MVDIFEELDNQGNNGLTDINLMNDLDKIFTEIQNNPMNENKFIEIPDGEYLCKVVRMEQRNSKAGNPMVIITFEILDTGTYNGMSIKQFTMLCGKTLEQTQRSLQKFYDICKELEFEIKSGATLSDMFEQFPFATNKIAVVKKSSHTSKKGTVYTDISFRLHKDSDIIM